MSDEHNERSDSPNDAALTAESAPAVPATPPAEEPATGPAEARGGLTWRMRLGPLWFLIYQVLLLLAASLFVFRSLTMGLLQTGGLFLFTVHLLWIVLQEKPSPSRSAYLRVLVVSALVLGCIVAGYFFVSYKTFMRN